MIKGKTEMLTQANIEMMEDLKKKTTEVKRAEAKFQAIQQELISHQEDRCRSFPALKIQMVKNVLSNVSHSK
jgi:hypothetical protein